MKGEDELKLKSIFVCLVLISVTTALSGCIGSDNVSAAEIKMSTINTSLDIYSYSFSMDMTITTNTDESKTTMSTNAIGAVDVLNNKLMMEISSVISSSLEMNLLYYLIDDVMFIKMDYFGSEQWIKMNFSDFNISWDSFDQMHMQVDLLDYGEVERLGDEFINNEDCYVLKITPDIDKLYDILMSQQGLNIGIFQNFSLSDMFKDFTLKIWISKENNYILKAYEYMVIEMTLFEYSSSMTFEINIEFNDYNKPVTIELPEEAQNAVSYLNLLSNISPSPPA